MEESAREIVALGAQPPEHVLGRTLAVRGFAEVPIESYLVARTH